MLHQLKDTISSIKNDPSRTLEEALLNQTSTVVQKVTDNVQEVEAMEGKHQNKSQSLKHFHFYLDTGT